MHGPQDLTEHQWQAVAAAQPVLLLQQRGLLQQRNVAAATVQYQISYQRNARLLSSKTAHSALQAAPGRYRASVWPLREAPSPWIPTGPGPPQCNFVDASVPAYMPPATAPACLSGGPCSHQAEADGLHKQQCVLLGTRGETRRWTIVLPYSCMHCKLATSESSQCKRAIMERSESWSKLLSRLYSLLSSAAAHGAVAVHAAAAPAAIQAAV